MEAKQSLSQQISAILKVRDALPGNQHLQATQRGQNQQEQQVLQQQAAGVAAALGPSAPVPSGPVPGLYKLYARLKRQHAEVGALVLYEGTECL